MQDAIYQNQTYWRGMTPAEVDAYAEQIFQHYRRSGYPHLRLDSRTIYQKLTQMQWLDYDGLIDHGSIYQTMHGLDIVWTFFPHAESVRCKGRPSPMDNFLDDRIFRGVIRKRLQYGTYMTDGGIRKALRVYNGAQAVSNFRPTAAAAIYRRYAPDRAVTWDMSAGYGGRRLGAALSQVVAHYHGSDPAALTVDGLRRLDAEIRRVYPKSAATIYQQGSEQGLPAALDGTVDLCFTSPPYFDTEKYSDEATQSCLRFPDYSEWLEGFIGATLEQCARALKPDGVLVVNIANTRRLPTLADDFLQQAEKHGFKLRETLQLQLSANPFQKEKLPYKCEPVFALTRGRKKLTTFKRGLAYQPKIFGA